MSHKPEIALEAGPGVGNAWGLKRYGTYMEMDIRSMTKCHSNTGFIEQLGVVARTAETTTSLVVLREIEQTVDSLTTIRNALSNVAALMHSKCIEVRQCDVEIGRYLDPEDTAIKLLKSAYQGLESHLSGLLVKKKAIDEDEVLNKDQQELLHDVYDDVLSACATTVEAAKDLRAAIIGHDLQAEPRNGSEYASTDSLVDALHETL